MAEATKYIIEVTLHPDEICDPEVLGEEIIGLTYYHITDLRVLGEGTPEPLYWWRGPDGPNTGWERMSEGKQQIIDADDGEEEEG